MSTDTFKMNINKSDSYSLVYSGLGSDFIQAVLHIKRPFTKKYTLNASYIDHRGHWEASLNGEPLDFDFPSEQSILFYLLGCVDQLQEFVFQGKLTA